MIYPGEGSAKNLLQIFLIIAQLQKNGDTENILCFDSALYHLFACQKSLDWVGGQVAGWLLCEWF